MEIVLNEEETETLLDVLRTYTEDLRMEIVDTDNPGYKRPLKHRRELVGGIADKLRAATEAPGAVAPDEGAVAPRVSLRLIAVW